MNPLLSNPNSSLFSLRKKILSCSSSNSLNSPKGNHPSPSRKTYLRKQGQIIINPDGSSTTTYLINPQGWDSSEED